MVGFVLGFLAEAGRGFGDRLDRTLPAPRVRRTLRGWRRRRPFWAAPWVIGGGVERVAIPLAPLPLMIKVGVGAMSAVGIGVVLVAGGLFFLFEPGRRMFVSIVTVVASLTSMATTNPGGSGLGMTAGLVGSSTAFGWMPEPDVDRPGGRPADEDDDAAATRPDDEPTTPGPATPGSAEPRSTASRSTGSLATAPRSTGPLATASRPSSTSAPRASASGPTSSRRTCRSPCNSPNRR